MHVHILGAYVHDMKFLWLNLLLGGLSTDDANDDNNATRWTIHDCIGSSAISKWAKNCGLISKYERFTPKLKPTIH